MKDIKKYTDIIRYGKGITSDVINIGDVISITEKIDGCFHYDTLITLSDGSKEKIGKIVNNKLNLQVMTYNLNTNKLEPKKIINWYNHGDKKEFICLKYQSPIRKGGRPNKIICTKDHLFWTNKGWKEAQYLTSDDVVYTFMEKLDYAQEQLIIGSLLGDSSIYPTLKKISLQRNRGIAYTHSNKQIDYANFKNKVLGGNFLKQENIVTGYGSEATRNLSICCKPIESLIKLCVNDEDKKFVNEDWVNLINPIALAFWYMDDGSLSHNINQKDRVVLHTEGFSELEIDLLINILEIKFNIFANKLFYKDKYYKISLDTYSSDIFFNLVCCYIPKCMQYKLPKEYHLETTFWDYYTPKNKNGLYPIQIIEQEIIIPNYINNFNNYDIEVEDNNNYFAGGLLVHNSNSSFILDETNIDGVTCYSRNTVLGVGDTLRGFSNWVKENIIPIKDKLNPNYRYFGEWLVSHKVKYKPECYSKFYLFSIFDETLGKYLSDEVVQAEANKLNILTVPYLYKGQFISFEHLMSFVGKSNMSLVPDEGEGIVVKNINYKDNYGNQMFVKLVSERFAEIQPQKLPKNPNGDILIPIVKSVLTKARVDKNILKLVDEGLLVADYSIQNMGDILKALGNRLYEDIMKEESELFEGFEENHIKRIVGKNIPNVVKEVLKEQGRVSL
jgi:intein/homing endonuclease